MGPIAKSGCFLRIPANVVGVDHVSHSSKNPGLQYVSLVQTTSKDTKAPSGCFVHRISVPPPQQVLHCTAVFPALCSSVGTLSTGFPALGLYIWTSH